MGERSIQSTRQTNGIPMYEKLINMVSDSTLQLMFKKILLVKYTCSIQYEEPQLSGKAI